VMVQDKASKREQGNIKFVSKGADQLEKIQHEARRITDSCRAQRGNERRVITFEGVKSMYTYRTN